ncbi:hypothetical protein JXQ31_14545 [candidate division KSB1 bacterium]|nr:hypothetical protein [candidate division KSB1 bacterium]
MGQQQLLLIVLSVIIVGIAVVVGIQTFGTSAAASNQEAVINDLMNMSARAQQYYVKPTGMGGGGNQFDGLGMHHMTPVAIGATSYTNENGTFTISTAGSGDAVTLQGVGSYKDKDGQVCQVQMTIGPNSITTTAITKVAAGA